MQREETVPEDYVTSVLSAAFRDSPFVCEAYSEFDRPLRSFGKLNTLLTHIHTQREQRARFFDLVIHYPGTKGYVRKTTINLKPEKCGGATWREKVEGWGLIQLQITYQDDPVAKCRIAANSEKRANAWAQTLHELRAPALWNWELVEKHTRRLIRVLRKGA